MKELKADLDYLKSKTDSIPTGGISCVTESEDMGGTNDPHSGSVSCPSGYTMTGGGVYANNSNSSNCGSEIFYNSPNGSNG